MLDASKWPIFSILDQEDLEKIKKICVFGSSGNEAVYITKDDEVYAIGSNCSSCLGLGNELRSVLITWLYFQQFTSNHVLMDAQPFYCHYHLLGVLIYHFINKTHVNYASFLSPSCREKWNIIKRWFWRWYYLNRIHFRVYRYVYSHQPN